MYFLWGIASIIVAFLFSYYLKNYSLKRKIALQTPRRRDLHESPTPRIGGLAIFGTMLLVFILLLIFAPQLTDFGFPYAILGFSIDKRLLGIILASIILVGVMTIDDIKGLNPFVKLSTQILCALILVLTGLGITYLNNPFGLAIQLDNFKIPLSIGANTFHFVVWADLILIVWVLILTNVTNFIDGLDGLAATLAIIASLILGILSLKVGQIATAILSFIFAGALIGFLPFNLPLPNAKIFLGDSGSMFIGLMLAVITFITGGKLATVVLVYGLVIIDALYVIAKRLIRGKNPLTSPDQTHIHHRFIEAGFSKAQTLIIICAISLLFGLSALIFAPKVKIFAIIILVILSLLLFISLDYSNTKRKNND
ncbi:hypothetical protein COT77_03500 [Candidatus Berkelbacteria bacterium CG10_big_fil_rev_8_21_14_0_10_41_12]|uniref:Undecaprenyl-phosphate alpha-N-acetylglucosaminyl 1-phosphate transferase n=1 Tax=Candidatus Berkelbacteria bacterium CG10_big_fil_rev_8_21_14_0_10_41_12 TaxID=1974513 RepID=A0A2M6WW93_9BACT|nr:MAG: hypothetical protein COT77_03500 [Candidatus Berkelbacteria bacterium CG10_big_fil_rev_8_21_14_0_10_41_12]